jgi:hypothetical protein
VEIPERKIRDPGSNHVDGGIGVLTGCLMLVSLDADEAEFWPTSQKPRCSIRRHPAGNSEDTSQNRGNRATEGALKKPVRWISRDAKRKLRFRFRFIFKGSGDR